jgi:hypothetical protein
MTAAGSKCECCFRERPIVGVASTMAPISIAWCRECLDNHAQPKWIIEGEIIQCGGRQHMRLGWDDGITFFDPTDNAYHPASEINVSEEQINEFWKEYEKACLNTQQ